ncbi:unnamed protein product [Closterium sp. NIES-53]
MDLAVRAQWALQQPISLCHVSASSAARRRTEFTNRSFGGNGGSPSFLLLSCCARFPARNSSARGRNSAASAARPRAVVVLRAGSRPLASPGRRKRMSAVVTASIGGGWGLGMGEAGSAVGSALGHAGSEREPAGWVKARGSTVAAATAVSLAGDGSNLYSDVSNLGEPIVEQDVLNQQQQGEMEQGNGGAAAAAAAAAAGVRGAVERESRGGGEVEEGRESVELEGVLERMRRAVRIECLAEGAHVHVTGKRGIFKPQLTCPVMTGVPISALSSLISLSPPHPPTARTGQSRAARCAVADGHGGHVAAPRVASWRPIRGVVCRAAHLERVGLSNDALEDSVCRPEIQSTVWDVDTAGRVSSLDLDDHEVYLLSVWLRSSLWLLPPVASSALDIRAVGGEEEIGEGGPVVGIPNGMRMEIDAHVAADDRVILAINLIGREVIMYVAVHRSDWLPRVAVVKAYGALETFTFTQWAPVAVQLWWYVQQRASAGAATDQRPGRGVSDQSGCAFHNPLSRLPPFRTTPPTPPTSYFLQDSGATCFTIEPAAGDRLA